MIALLKILTLSVFLLFLLFGCASSEKDDSSTDSEAKSGETSAAQTEQIEEVEELVFDNIVDEGGLEEFEAEPIPEETVVRKAVKQVIPSTVAAGQGGFVRLRSDCNMRDGPRGKKLGVLPKGRRLWVDNKNGKWIKIYRKRSVAYIAGSCLR